MITYAIVVVLLLAFVVFKQHSGGAEMDKANNNSQELYDFVAACNAVLAA
jgi:preprotein translocase subunit SecG